MWGWIGNGILAAGPSRVTIRRKATADIGARRSLMKQPLNALIAAEQALASRV
jgi:hypothetical protein